MIFLDRLYRWLGGARAGVDAHSKSGPIVLLAEHRVPEILRALEAFRPAQRVVPSSPDLKQQLEALRPSLLVISVELEGENGFLLFKRLMREARFERIPTVIYSTQATVGTLEQHRKLRYHADGYAAGNGPEEIQRAVAEALLIPLPP